MITRVGCSDVLIADGETRVELQNCYMIQKTNLGTHTKRK